MSRVTIELTEDEVWYLYHLLEEQDDWDVVADELFARMDAALDALEVN